MKKNIFVVFFVLLSMFFSINAFASHTIKLKITNNNTDSSCENNWCQVYVEIPAKLYMDKGWLRSDLENLRFNDGSRNLNYWVIQKKDYNLKINKLGLWLLVYDLKPNSTKFINMIIDDNNSVSYCNPLADSSVQSYDRTSYNCAASVFEFYSPNFNDWKWSKYPSSNSWDDPDTIFEDNSLYTLPYVYPIRDGDNAKTGNEFTLHIDNLKYYDPTNYYKGEIKIYFLSQAPYENPEKLKSKPGYRVYIKKATDFWNVSDNLHYSRRHFKIKLQEKEKGTNWVTKAVTDWYVYNNSRYVFDLRVSENKIYLYINGQHFSFAARNGASVDSDGNLLRGDDFEDGYFGFNRLGWRKCCGTDIDYIFIRKFFKNDPEVEVYGNSDLVVGLNSPTKGENLIELTPDVQNIDASDLGGNTLDKYIYATYDIASDKQIVKNLKIRFRNRSSSTQLFHIAQQKQTNNPNNWLVYWCDNDGNNCSLNVPDNITINGNSYKDYTIKVIPSPSVLFNGGSLFLKIQQFGYSDSSFDNAEFNINVNSKLGCFWKWKLPVSINWDAAHGYDTLRNYQVLVNINGVTQLKDANNDGSDIVVTDSSGNIIPFWIKKFDKNAKKLSLWVKLPKIINGSSIFYIWWGNSDLRVPYSDIKRTFDLWENWDDYALNSTVGCPDGTAQCNGASLDPDGWRNIATPDDFYNWWKIEDRPSGNNILRADMGKNHWSNDTGPYLLGGKVAWNHYEVSYKMNAGSYYNYNGNNNTLGNPQYNPVFTIDAGNMWGMEFFANKFIFRPYASGIDYTWQYQTYPKNILGEVFPKNDQWYWVKVRVFKDKITGEAHLTILITKSSATDPNNINIDSDSDFNIVGNFTAPPAFSLPYGKIGFGGWNGGFYFDDIRVRKYVTGANGKEPTCTPNNEPSELNPRGKISLSQPQITPPFFSGREAYLVSETTPFSWLGDIKAYDAECYIGDNCNDDENPNELGTISMFGEIDDNASEAKGLGYFLMKQLPKDRTIYTLDDNITNNQSNGFDYFNLSDCKNLENVIGSTGTCNANDNLTDETEKIIEFVRGKFIKEFPKSKSRNMDEKYGNNNGIPEDNEQWKLGDIIHSNPIIIGLPNMHWADDSYQQWVNDMREKARPLMLYTLSNDGMLHAFKIAYYNKNANPPRYEVVDSPTESWAFVPNGVLHKLKEITEGTGHQYSDDGLLRSIDIYDSSKNKWMTVLFGLLGRGGEGLFAIDITDPNNPKLLWDINKYRNPEIFSKIGTTISSPAMGKININGSVRWVAFVGSGFDVDFLKSLTTKHAYLTIVDLLNGHILKQIEVSNKIGDVLTNIAPLRSPDGYLRKIYFGDYYGALWRVNITDSSDNNTTHFNQLLHSSKPVLGSEDMLFKPADYDLTQFPNTVERPITAQPIPAWDGSNWWVYFGTGDYTDIDNNYSSDGDSIYPYQRFYGLRDENSVTYEDSSLYNMTDPNSINSSNSSWFIELGHNNNYDVEKTLNDNGSLIPSQNKNSNERVLQKAEVYNGIVFFTTFQPKDSPCGGGISRFYSVNYKTGGLVQQLFGFSNGNQTEYKTARSVQLSGNEVPSKPMIYKGEGSTKAIAAGVVNKGGQLEKIKLNPSKFSEKIDIRLWRVVK